MHQYFSFCQPKATSLDSFVNSSGLFFWLGVGAGSQETILSANKNDIPPSFPLFGLFLLSNCAGRDYQCEAEIRHLITEQYWILSDFFLCAQR